MLLNQYYKDAFKGKLIMRFDDNNPAKEGTVFEKVSCVLDHLQLAIGLTDHCQRQLTIGHFPYQP